MSETNGSTTGEKRKADAMDADTVTVKLSELIDLSNKAGIIYIQLMKSRVGCLIM